MYIYIFIWLFLIGGVVNITQLYNIEKNENNIVVKRWISLMAVVLFFPVFWNACIVTPVNDVPIYIVLEWIIKCIFHGDVTAFRICLALIHSVPVIYIFRKYCEQYWIGIYLFVASACPMAWMMNGMRQFVAVVIIFSALPLMIRKEYMKVILLVILATTFHMSAIIMLPIVFIVQGKACVKTAGWCFACVGQWRSTGPYGSMPHR